jgi:hypothetical protein
MHPDNSGAAVDQFKFRQLLRCDALHTRTGPMELKNAMCGIGATSEQQAIR